MTDTVQDSSQAISKELATGKFTDKMLADMRALIGTELRTAASINNEYATRTAILRFCEGIGDDNPLWTDAAYAESTHFGTLVAPPSFIFACLGSIQVGWPGLGGFHCETKLSFGKPIRVGDRITAKVIFDGFDGPIDDSNFGGRRIKDYLRQEYRNQHGELVAHRDLGNVFHDLWREPSHERVRHRVRDDPRVLGVDARLHDQSLVERL